MRALIVLAGAWLALLACAPPGQAAAPHPSPSPDVTATVRQLMYCGHAHGAPDFPDPTLDDRGVPRWPDGTPLPPQEAIDACGTIYARLPNPDRSGPLTTQELRLARQFAACMRQHGLGDWPDPNADGSYPLPADLQAEGKSPRLRAAWDACARYNPSGHINVSTGGS